MLRQSKQKAEIALLTWVNEMHTQGMNGSSKMMKEMGISILGRVNEMLQNEKKIHLTFSNGWLFKIHRRWGLRGLEVVGCDHKNVCRTRGHFYEYDRV